MNASSVGSIILIAAAIGVLILLAISQFKN